MKVLLPDFKKRGGLVTVIAQDYATKEILMVAFTDQAGFLETLQTGKAVYFSTSRNERWMKGETSGAFQYVRAIHIDCDGDAIIYLIDQEGCGACHTGARTCFFRNILNGSPLLSELPGKDHGVELESIEVEVAQGIAPGQ